MRLVFVFFLCQFGVKNETAICIVFMIVVMTHIYCLSIGLIDALFLYLDCDQKDDPKGCINWSSLSESSPAEIDPLAVESKRVASRRLDDKFNERTSVESKKFRF